MKSSIPDLISETPQTRVAAVIAGTYVRDAGEYYRRAIEGALREMACEVAKQALGLDGSEQPLAKGGRRK